MSDNADLLVEVGTEELPPRALKSLSEALGRELQAGLETNLLAHGDVTVYATPRRLAALIKNLPLAQADREVERRGPSVEVAFDSDGAPTKAALGFARSVGLEVEHLGRLETDQGAWLAFRSTEVGEPTASLLPSIVQGALDRLPIPRRMRWADIDAEFVRPVHWLVLLLGDEVVEAELLGVSAGRMSRGHRFHHPEALAIEQPDAYATTLYGNGHVVADFAQRAEMIRLQVEEAAAALGGKAVIDEALLEEVTALVEWPVALAGGFAQEFLELPDAVLVGSMQSHQKYFPVVDAQGALMAHFVTVSNIESRTPDVVRKGNERVIRPRLADAAFFFEKDLETPLADRCEALKDVVFQEKLGSIFDKSERVSRLAGHVAIAIGESPDEVKLARRAGQLYKADLLSEMVGEFPELQGAMGGEYARRGGEDERVADALAESYMPRFARDTIPASRLGKALAIADKLDTLLGIFGIGQAPTGDRDPFALRRAALGTLRIVIEGELDLELPKLLAAAAEGYADRFDREQVAAQVSEFMIDRLRAYFTDQGIPANVFNAVQARSPSRPYDFARRMRAVDQFRQMPGAASLAAANKRIQNILKQNDDAVAAKVDEALFADDAEWNLAAMLVGLGPRVKAMLKSGDYTGAMGSLAGLKDNVDAFFDNVKVMDDDTAVRANRLALLNSISELFLATADISRLQE